MSDISKLLFDQAAARRLRDLRTALDIALCFAIVVSFAIITWVSAPRIADAGRDLLQIAIFWIAPNVEATLLATLARSRIERVVTSRWRVADRIARIDKAS